MAETKMHVELIAHTQLSDEFRKWIDPNLSATDGQVISLTAIRTCYSPLEPTDIVLVEGDKYFGREATDGGTGTDADRLFRHIVKSGHTSTLEHLSFTFAVEGVSRSLLTQLTRHRVGFSYSVQSQRYVKLGSNDKSGGFDYVVPDKIKNSDKRISIFDDDSHSVKEAFEYAMYQLQQTYDTLRAVGIPAEDARAVLPNATATNLVVTANLRALLDFYSKRRKGRGAQHEITELAEAFRREVVVVEPWTDQFFEIA
jgi:thymidylate synthase (FAD)